MKLIGKILAWALALVLAVAVGGWFALKRDDIPFETLEQKYAGPDSKYVEIAEGMRIRYIEAGPADAPVILLVHGNGISLDTWRPWVKVLAADYRVVALDLPGHGLTRSPQGWDADPQAFAEVIHQFADKLKLERFTLVGQSLGGFAAWEYALKHPERLDSLVLVAAAGWPDERPEFKERDQSVISRLLRTEWGRRLLRDLDSTAILKNGMLLAYANDAMVTDALVARYAELGRGPGHRQIAVDMMGTWPKWPMASAERLSAIRVPTLILQGEKDELVPADHGRKFQAAIPGSKLIVYQGVGHVLNEEVADRSANDLKAFLGELPETAAETPKPEAPKPEAPATLPDVGNQDPSLIFH